MDADRLLCFLREELCLDVSGISDHTPLFSSGRLDSFALVDLTSFLEHAAQLTIEVEEMVVANFDSIGRIADFCRRKLERGGALTESVGLIAAAS